MSKVLEELQTDISIVILPAEKGTLTEKGVIHFRSCQNCRELCNLVLEIDLKRLNEWVLRTGELGPSEYLTFLQPEVH